MKSIEAALVATALALPACGDIPDCETPKNVEACTREVEYGDNKGVLLEVRGILEHTATGSNMVLLCVDYPMLPKDASGYDSVSRCWTDAGTLNLNQSQVKVPTDSENVLFSLETDSDYSEITSNLNDVNGVLTVAAIEPTADGNYWNQPIIQTCSPVSVTIAGLGSLPACDSETR